jgi:hypothetical protein
MYLDVLPIKKKHTTFSFNGRKAVLGRPNPFPCSLDGIERIEGNIPQQV